VSSRYKAPFTFTGGTIAKVNVDVSGRPYEDVEKELALAFSRD
jgi:arylsulfatase